MSEDEYENKFKSIDAIRDILHWYGARKNFHIVLTDWDDDEQLMPETLAISPAHPEVENYRNITGAIESIIDWLDSGRDFDIALTPTDPFIVNLN